MFSVGQTVLYGTNGVCRIEKITTRRVGSSEMEYYVLKPVRSDCSTVFVPTGNETLVSRMRFVKSADEVRAILDDRTFSIDWIDNKNLRAERFRGIISGEDCRELVALVRLIHARAAAVTAQGKRLHISDDRILREAEKMAGDEIATSLGVTREEAIALILGKKLV